VIIANPARVVALAQVIRKHVVQLATARLSDEARAENTMRLYDFITSDRCSVLLEQIGTVSDKLLDLDVKEHRAHTATWKQRGQLIREIQQARGTLVTEIELIVTTLSGQPEEEAR
jgi:predicted secreted protein